MRYGYTDVLGRENDRVTRTGHGRSLLRVEPGVSYMRKSYKYAERLGEWCHRSSSITINESALEPEPELTPSSTVYRREWGSVLHMIGCNTRGSFQDFNQDLMLSG